MQSNTSRSFATMSEEEYSIINRFWRWRWRRRYYDSGGGV